MTPLQKWYDGEHPEVSVVILNFNRSDLTKDCLEALWTNTRGYRYEILVVDNGSAPDEVQKLADAGTHFRLIRLPENRHFGAGCNIGAQQSKGRYLVFLNNDAFVTSDWLAPLIRLFVDHSDAGAVGPRLIYPDGRRQEAGAFINETGDNLQVGMVKAYHPGEELETRIVDYCSGACLAIPKQVFNELGGFDPIYDPAYYEDVDLCFKIAAAQKFVYYCPASTVVHVLNATSASVWSAVELQKIVAASRQKFLSRWGDWLRARAENREIPFPHIEPMSAVSGQERSTGSSRRMRTSRRPHRDEGHSE
jgi:GT2 family glycosyltransferase